MKRLLSVLLGSALTVAAAAQDWQDARYFTENNYLGTARSLGMGNAMTAIGGDVGSLTFNPAGSAVAGYSQFTLSPGFTLSTMNAAGVVAPGNSAAIGLGNQVSTVYGRVKLPNVGIIITRDSGRRSGWKRSSFGFVINATSDYTGRVKGAGVNADNSYAAALASSAELYSENVLGTEDWWYDGNDLSRMPKWVDMVGYRSGMFNGIPGAAGYYQAVTEVRDASNNRWLAGPVNQEYGQQTYGSKYDFLLNYAADYEDKFYVGVNLGFTTLNYSLAEYWQESPEHPEEFPTIEYTDGTKGSFTSLQMKRNYRQRGSGVYLKAGVLWRPVAGLRLGAAFQTPTLFTFNARQAYSGEVRMSGKSLTPSTSPEDNWTFPMVQPMRFNLGAAYSFGSFAVISADYEAVDYGAIRYRRDSSGSLPNYLNDANLDIQDVLGWAHQLRAGVEIKPVPALSLRAGYNLITYGQKNWLEADFSTTPLTAQEKAALFKHQGTFGVGYSFNSFFLDAAVRMRFLPTEYLVAYNYYGYGSYTDKYVDDSVLTPEIEIKSMIADVILTFGWRF